MNVIELILTNVEEKAEKIEATRPSTCQAKQRQNSVSSKAPESETISVLMENENCKKLVNYKYKTNLHDSPTKRLISIMNFHERNSSMSSSNRSYRSSPAHQKYLLLY
jgi:hypothetical protein